MDVVEEGDGELGQHCSHPKAKLGGSMLTLSEKNALLLALFSLYSQFTGTKNVWTVWEFSPHNPAFSESVPDIGVDLSKGESIDGMVSKLVRQLLPLC